MKIEIAPRAVLDAERAERWWRENRPAASTRFEEELREVLDQIRGAPEVGTVYRARSDREHRRVLMKQTRFHVYYRVVTPLLIRVVALWSAQRGRGPQL